MVGKIDPYIEAPVVRQLPIAPIGSGSDLSNVEQVLQGVEITTDRQRYAGTLPKLGSGERDNSVVQMDFGQSSFFSTGGVPFKEIPKYDPISRIENSLASTEPVILDDDGILDPELTMDGVIEPLTIGSRASLAGIEAPFIAHSVKGDIQAGNEDSFRKTDRVSQLYPLAPVRPELYVDSSGFVGSSLTGSILTPGFFPDTERQSPPYIETIRLQKSHPVDTSWGADVRNAVLAMTGSSTDDYVPLGQKSAGTGFTYSTSPAGTDSLAFGGLKRR